MNPDDSLKTAFTTSDVVYYYIGMPFVVKIVVATFQRLMNEVFAHQMGHNLETYIDDTIVKRMTFEDQPREKFPVTSTLQHEVK